MKPRADPREVAAIVERAWITNVEDDFAQCAMRAWARDEFQRTVGGYVREFYARTGAYPIGDHDVTGKGRGRLHFSPRAVVKH